MSYSRNPLPGVADTYRVEFTLEGGVKKAFDLKLAPAGPGLWQVSEIRAVG